MESTKLETNCLMLSSRGISTLSILKGSTPSKGRSFQRWGKLLSTQSKVLPWKYRHPTNSTILKYLDLILWSMNPLMFGSSKSTPIPAWNYPVPYCHASSLKWSSSHYDWQSTFCALLHATIQTTINIWYPMRHCPTLNTSSCLTRQ